MSIQEMEYISPESTYTSFRYKQSQQYKLIQESGKAIIAAGSKFPKTRRNRDASIVTEHPKFSIATWELMYVRIDILHEMINKMAEFIFHEGTRIRPPKYLREESDFKIEKIPRLSENIAFVRRWHRFIQFDDKGEELFKSALWAGNGYAEIVYDPKSAWNITFIKIINPKEMRVVRDYTGDILGYVQFPFHTNSMGTLGTLSMTTVNRLRDKHGSDKVIFFEPQEILHLKWDALPGDAYGISIFESLKDIVAIYIGMREDMPIIVRNNAIATILWQLGSDTIPASEESIEEFANYLESNYGIDTNLVASSLVTPVPIDTSSKIIDLPKYLKITMNMLMAGAGIPEILLGQGNETTEATAKQQLESVEKKFRSMQRKFKNAIELQTFSWLLKDKPPDLLLPKDMDELPEIYFPAIESVEDKRLRLENATKNGSITHEEYRQEYGYIPERKGSIILAEDKEYQMKSIEMSKPVFPNDNSNSSNSTNSTSTSNKTNKKNGKTTQKPSDRNDKKA